MASYLSSYLSFYPFGKNITGFGVDSTDRSSWVRSGLRLHIDAKTGVQYLSDGNGGLIVREKAEK